VADALSAKKKLFELNQLHPMFLAGEELIEGPPPLRPGADGALVATM
jgi:hypothetical protein